MPTAKPVSIIIPTLNEVDSLPGLLADLAVQEDINAEVLVCDGGSTDGTAELAAAAHLVRSAAGRGRQMNAGASQARQPWLLFLHADSRLTHPRQIATALSLLSDTGEPRIAGHFGLRFTGANEQRLFRHMERKSRLGRPGTINGDQGLLLHRDYFRALGGFDDSLPFLEDQRISRRIFDSGEWRLLPHPLETSARRFDREGAGARYFLMMVIMCAEQAGLDSFFQRRVYPRQDQTGHLLVAPHLTAIMECGEAARADFWRLMADYTLDNAWQLFFALDGLPGGGRWLRAYDRLLARRLPRHLLLPLLASLLRQLFRGPILRYWQRRDQKV